MSEATTETTPTTTGLPIRDLFYGTKGPRNARVMIVGEAWGRNEQDDEKPFIGMSGEELNSMLAEAGIDWRECFFTNVCAARPERNEMFNFFYPEVKGMDVEILDGLKPQPIVVSEIERLYRQIKTVKPAIIVAAGNYSLWALSDQNSIARISPYGKGGPRYTVPTGIGSHRGSMHFIKSILPDVSLPEIPLLPIIHPSAILRQWELRAPTVHDLKRIPKAFTGDWRPANPPIILAPPSFKEAMDRFDFMLRRAVEGPYRVTSDIETSRGLITCIGFCDDVNFAMVVPFVRLLEDRSLASFWTHEEEVALVRRMREIFRHPNILIEGQNFIYDIQYIQEWLAVTPRLDFDTMLAHHLIFPGTPKDLSHLSSLYCEYHWHWKDDNKEWDTKGSLSQHLLYNGMDNLRTYEVAGVLRRLIPEMGMEHLWEERKRVGTFCLKMMNRGVLIDKRRRAKMAMDIATMITQLTERMTNIIPVEMVDEVVSNIKGRKASPSPWYRSPDKQKIFFSEVLGIKLPKSRKTGEDTLGKEGLEDLRVQYPQYKLLFDLLSDIRSLGVFQNNFCAAPLEPNGRMKCSFNPGGTETFRLSSSENAFGRGTNLQNLPVGDEK